MLSLIYSVGNYVVMTVLEQHLQNYITQCQSLSLFPFIFQDAINSNRAMTIDPSYTIIDIGSSKDAYNDILNVNNAGTDLQDFYPFTLQNNDEFTEQFIQLFFGNACQFLPLENVTSQTCNQSFNSTMQFGVINAKEEIFETLRENYVAYATNGSSINMQVSYYELDDDIQNFLIPIIENFLSYEQDFLSVYNQQKQQLETIFFALYLLIICLGSLVLWFPYVATLNKEISRTTRMINMIPIEVVKQTFAIKKYLKDLVRTGR